MLNRDQILSQFGLQTRKTARDYLLPAVGLVTAGAAVGAGVALLFAPKSGKAMRENIREGAKASADKIADGAGRVVATAGSIARKLPFVPSVAPVSKPLEEMNKDELYARAQELEIDGRSDMSKEELYEAVRVS